MTSDGQDRIVKQLEDRYTAMECTQHPDGSLTITAKRTALGGVSMRRIVVVGQAGDVIQDSGEYEDG
jgi:hypothetical protein